MRLGVQRQGAGRTAPPSQAVHAQRAGSARVVPPETRCVVLTGAGARDCRRGDHAEPGAHRRVGPLPQGERPGHPLPSIYRALSGRQGTGGRDPGRGDRRDVPAPPAADGVTCGARCLPLGLALLVAAPAGWADPSFGLGAVSTLPAAFAPLRLAGVRTVKITADWSAIEPAAGRFLWRDVDAV